MKALNFIPNILLIAGTGRNTGKTTFATEIIRNISSFTDICAIKISPHFHQQKSSLTPIEKGHNYEIFREESTQSSKDSSRFLKAGAKEVFYVQAFDDALLQLLSFMKETSPDTPIIIESGGLRKFIKPDIFLILQNSENPKKDHFIYDDTIFVTFNNNSFDHNPHNFIFKDGKWQYLIRN